EGARHLRSHPRSAVRARYFGGSNRGQNAHRARPHAGHLCRLHVAQVLASRCSAFLRSGKAHGVHKRRREGIVICDRPSSPGANTSTSSGHSCPPLARTARKNSGQRGFTFVEAAVSALLFLYTWPPQALVM